MHNSEHREKLSIAIVDDEFHARSMMEHYIHQIPFLQLVGQYDNCLTCYDHHDFDTLDILLLDINLPEVSGLQFARTITKNKTTIIMTTAYSEYAVEGYHLNVADYLLKPIQFERFKSSIEKIQEVIQLKRLREKMLQQESRQTLAVQKDHIFVKSDYKIIKVNLSDIVYIEGLQEYVQIFLESGKTVTTLMSLKKIEEMLPTPPFFRIHRSHLINIEHLEYVHQKSIHTHGKDLSIGKNYEDAFFQYILSNSES